MFCFKGIQDIWKYFLPNPITYKKGNQDWVILRYVNNWFCFSENIYSLRQKTVVLGVIKNDLKTHWDLKTKWELNEQIVYYLSFIMMNIVPYHGISILTFCPEGYEFYF